MRPARRALENNPVTAAACDRLIPEDPAELGRKIAARRGGKGFRLRAPDTRRRIV